MRMVGVPAPFVLMMTLMRGMWRKLKAVAPTLPYDFEIMGDWQVPGRLAALETPTLAMYEQLLQEAESDLMAADVRGEIEATGRGGDK